MCLVNEIILARPCPTRGCHDAVSFMYILASNGTGHKITGSEFDKSSLKCLVVPRTALLVREDMKLWMLIPNSAGKVGTTGTASDNHLDTKTPLTWFGCFTEYFRGTMMMLLGLAMNLGTESPWLVQRKDSVVQNSKGGGGRSLNGKPAYKEMSSLSERSTLLLVVVSLQNPLAEFVSCGPLDYSSLVTGLGLMEHA